MCDIHSDQSFQFVPLISLRLHRMEKLVKFKQVIDSLNDEEYKSFLDLYGRNNIIKLIFNDLSFDINHNVTKTVDQTNELISQIITLRDADDSTENPNTPHTKHS